ncbi:MAG TPA: VIT1/CCC1 transporter family protein, partial [Candidatus Limnocylindrales bacterium]|nr:VIT1/CCC1 transporter family protein [Candidatus Limnocylindrales bacterium]
SSKSQREIYLAQIQNEREEVEARPDEAQAEVAFMLEREGLDEAAARRVAAELAREPRVLLKTMVEKELGIVVEPGRGALHGAIIMGGAFGLASLVPILPYLFVDPAGAVPYSIAAAALFMFGIGVLKSRWTKRHPLLSGAEILLLATVAGLAGYFFGSVLPALLGVEAPPG